MQLKQMQKESNNIEQTINTTGSKRDFDAVIVGGGLAGLATATLLAREGKRVVVLEKSVSVGGRAISQEHKGYTFNLGPHALYSKSPAVEVLDELGITYTGGNPSGIRMTHANGNYVAPVDTMTLLGTKLLTLSEKWQAGRMLTKLLMADPGKYAEVTLKEWLAKEKGSTLVKELLRANARTVMYTDAPEVLSMDVFIAQTKQVTKGKVVYVDGGWQALVDGLVRAARSAGVQIVTAARVEKVEQHNGAATGVRLADGTIYSTSAVVVAAAPRDFLLLAGELANTSMRAWIEGSVVVKAACLDVALRTLPRPDNAVVMSVDHPIFLTTQSEFSKIAPKGGALLHGLKYLDPSVPQDAEQNRRDLEGRLDALQPSWRKEVIEQRYLPNLVVSNSLPLASQGGLAGRPGTAVPGAANLYVVGDWVGPEGMLASASLTSAKSAAQMILQNSTSGAYNVRSTAASTAR